MKFAIYSMLKNSKKKESVVKKMEVQDMFMAADRTIKIDENKKEETIMLLQKNIEEKQINVISSRKRILFNQFKYMDKSMIYVHLIFCIVLLLIAAVMKHYEAEEKDIILYSLFLAGVLGVVSVMGIGRIFGTGIAELGESCYFNVSQIVALHMLISGIINLTVLSIGIVFVGIQWRISLLRLGLYVLVPFVTAQSCCLKVLLTEAGRKNSYLLIMVGVFLVIFYMIIGSIPEVYKVTAYAVWAVVLIVGLMLMGVQIKALFRGIEKGEIICMN